MYAESLLRLLGKVCEVEVLSADQLVQLQHVLSLVLEVAGRVETS
mgnify:FL=1